MESHCLLRAAAFAVVAAVLPAPAMAAPVRVTKGPIITGVSPTEAWIAWETTKLEGAGLACVFAGHGSLDIDPPISAQRTFEDKTCSHIHHVHLTGLTPSTRYRLSFKQRYGPKQKAEGSFTTAPVGVSKPFSFVVYGDNREAPPPLPSTRADHVSVTAAIRRMDQEASFLVHTGDLALNIRSLPGVDDGGYPEFFDVERDLLAHEPIFAVVGNHETFDMTEFNAFVNPRVFAHAPHPYYYSFDWGRAHFALIDAFEGPMGTYGRREPEMTPEQEQWLDEDLRTAAAHNQLIFLVTHQSPFSHPAAGAHAHGSSKAIEDAIVPLMLKYHAAAVFAGHDHYYQRGHEGCIDYFVVGGGGAPMYEPDPKAPGVAVARKAVSYVSVSVDEHEATATAKAVSGEIMDTFKLSPADGSACQKPLAPPPSSPAAPAPTSAPPAPVPAAAPAPTAPLPAVDGG